MANALRCALILGLSGFLAACGDQSSIDEGGEVFDTIGQAETITLVGNEPFWSFEIVAQGDGYMATYTHPENIIGTTAEVARFAGNNGLGFSGELDGAALQIALTPGECSDTMSDRVYPYTTTIKLGDEDLRGCGYSTDNPFQSGDEE